MNKHYFNSIEEAEKFIKANNITGYHFETPEYLEDGVDLVIHKTFICEICGTKMKKRLLITEFYQEKRGIL